MAPKTHEGGQSIPGYALSLYLCSCTVLYDGMCVCALSDQIIVYLVVPVHASVEDQECAFVVLNRLQLACTLYNYCSEHAAQYVVQ